MRTFVVLGIALVMLGMTLGAQQRSQNGVIQGNVHRTGTPDAVSAATVSLIPAQTIQAFDALARAGEGVVMPGLKGALPDLLVMSVDDFRDLMKNGIAGRALPPSVVTALQQLQSAKESTRAFPDMHSPTTPVTFHSAMFLPALIP